MEWLTIEQVKLHLRLDHDEEDSLLASLIKVAAEYVETDTRRSLADWGGPIPESVRVAGLHLVALWYENRQGVTDRPLTAIPFGIDALLQPYRRSPIAY